MKLVAIIFDDTVDISVLTKDKEVSVSDGTATVSGGKIILAAGEVSNPEVIPHIHSATTEVGPPSTP